MNRVASGLAGVLLLVVTVAAAGAFVYGLIVGPAVAGPIAGATGVVIAAVVQRRWEKKQRASAQVKRLAKLDRLFRLLVVLPESALLPARVNSKLRSVEFGCVG